MDIVRWNIKLLAVGLLIIAFSFFVSASTHVQIMGWGDYGYGIGSMRGGNWYGVVGIFGVILWLVAFINLTLLGIFLWKKMRK